MRGRRFVVGFLAAVLLAAGSVALPMEQQEAPGTPWALVVAADLVGGREMPVVEPMREIAMTLRSRYGFRTVELYDDKATERSILQQLDKMVNLTRRDSLVVIFSVPSMTDRGGTPVLLLFDEEWGRSKIRADELSASVSRVPAQSLVIFQGCQWLGVDLGRLSGSLYEQKNVGGYGAGEVSTFSICEGFKTKGPPQQGVVLLEALNRLADEGRPFGLKELAGTVSESAEVALSSAYFSFRPTSGVETLFTRLDTANDVEDRKQAIRTLPAELKTFVGDREAIRDQAASRLTAIAGDDNEEVALRVEALSSLRKMKATDVDWLLGLTGKSDAPRAVRLGAFESLAADRSPGAQDGILQLIDADLSELRREAYWYLSDRGDPQSTLTLVQRLATERDSEVLEAGLSALQVLGRQEPAVSELVVSLLVEGENDPDAPIRKPLPRRKAIPLLAYGDSPGSRSWLSNCLLEDEDSGVRQASAYAIGQVPSPEGLDALMQALGDRSGHVREAAVRSLGRVGSDAAPAAAKIRRLLLEDEIVQVRIASAEALAGLGDQAAGDSLAGALEDEDAGVRRAAVEAVVKLRLTGSRGMLSRLAKADPNRQVRQAAGNALSELQQPTLALDPDFVADALGDDDPATRRAMIDRLTKTGSDGAVSYVATMLGDADYSVRQSAIRGLQGLPQAMVIAELIPKYSEAKSGLTREAAIQVLGPMGQPEAQAALFKALDDRDSGVRAAALRSLGNYTSDQALEATRSRSKTKDPRMALAAADAMSDQAKRILAQGDAPKAIDLLQYGLEVRRGVVGGLDKNVAGDFRLLAQAFDRAGEKDAAVEYLNRSIEIFSESVGLEDRATVAAKEELASLHASHGNLELAEEAYRSIVRTLESGDPRVQGYYRRLIDLAEQRNDQDQVDYYTGISKKLESRYKSKR